MDRREISIRIGAADLMARYQLLADSGKLDALGQLFTEDAVFVNNVEELVGREAIVGFFKQVGRAFASPEILPARHHLSSVLITPHEGGTATTYGYFHVLSVRGSDHWGIYRDHVVLGTEGWRFRRRQAIVEGCAANSPVKLLLGLTDAGTSTPI